MYYAEQYINGNLHYKTTPDDEWTPFTIEMLNKRILELEDKIFDLQLEMGAR